MKTKKRVSDNWRMRECDLPRNISVGASLFYLLLVVFALTMCLAFFWIASSGTLQLVYLVIIGIHSFIFVDIAFGMYFSTIGYITSPPEYKWMENDRGRGRSGWAW